MLLQIEEIEQLPPSAECERAIDRLYLQAQLLAEELFDEGHGLSVIPGGRAMAGRLAAELRV